MRIQVSSLVGLLLVGVFTVSLAQPNWNETVLLDNYGQAKCVQVVDLNYDGLRDIVTASRDEGCHWWENTGDCFIPHLIINEYDFAFIEVVDLDSDMDLDIAAATYSDDSIIWIENLWDDWQTHLITDNAGGAYHVATHDVDRDGDKDILACYYIGNEVVLWENGPGDVWQGHHVLNTTGPVRSDAGDLDDDGDVDFVISSYVDHQILVAENLGNNISFTPHVILDDYANAWSVTVRHIDEDGIWDILTSAWSDDSIDWLQGTAEGPFIRPTSRVRSPIRATSSPETWMDKAPEILSAPAHLMGSHGLRLTICPVIGPSISSATQTTITPPFQRVTWTTTAMSML